jgi:hypothetical protein
MAAEEKQQDSDVVFSEDDKKTLGQQVGASSAGELLIVAPMRLHRLP